MSNYEILDIVLNIGAIILNFGLFCWGLNAWKNRQKLIEKRHAAVDIIGSVKQLIKRIKGFRSINQYWLENIFEETHPSEINKQIFLFEQFLLAFKERWAFVEEAYTDFEKKEANAIVIMNKFDFEKYFLKLKLTYLQFEMNISILDSYKRDDIPDILKKRTDKEIKHVFEIVSSNQDGDKDIVRKDDFDNKLNEIEKLILSNMKSFLDL